MSNFIMSNGRAVFTPEFTRGKAPTVSEYRQGIAEETQANELMDYFHEIAKTLADLDGSAEDRNPKRGITAIIDHPSPLANAPGLLSCVLVKGPKTKRSDIAESPEEYLLAGFSQAQIERTDGDIVETINVLPNKDGAFIRQWIENKETHKIYDRDFSISKQSLDFHVSDSDWDELQSPSTSED